MGIDPESLSRSRWSEQAELREEPSWPHRADALCGRRACAGILEWLPEVVGYGFDEYEDLCVDKALATLLEHRDELVEPVAWIKLQMGGQGELWVTHVTVNHGVGRERRELEEKHFELYLQGRHPGHVDEAVGHQPMVEVLESHGAVPSEEEDEERRDEVLELAWELTDSILSRAMSSAGHRIKAGLQAAGVQVHDACVVCFGAEDDTWGWNGTVGYDPETALSAADLEGFDPALYAPLARLMFERPENQAWFMRRAQA